MTRSVRRNTKSIKKYLKSRKSKLGCALKRQTKYRLRAKTNKSRRLGSIKLYKKKRRTNRRQSGGAEATKPLSEFYIKLAETETGTQPSDSYDPISYTFSLTEDTIQTMFKNDYTVDETTPSYDNDNDNDGVNYQINRNNYEFITSDKKSITNIDAILNQIGQDDVKGKLKFDSFMIDLVIILGRSSSILLNLCNSNSSDKVKSVGLGLIHQSEYKTDIIIKQKSFDEEPFDSFISFLKMNKNIKFSYYYQNTNNYKSSDV